MFANRDYKRVFSYINDDSVLNDPKLREQIEGGAPPAEEQKTLPEEVDNLDSLVSFIMEGYVF